MELLKKKNYPSKSFGKYSKGNNFLVQIVNDLNEFNEIIMKGQLIYE